MTSDQENFKHFALPSLAILGGGPGGYEAALVAASMGSHVTIIERVGMGGAAVLTDVVPSKTLIATAEAMNRSADSGELGVSFEGADGTPKEALKADLKLINERVMRLAREQSTDIRRGLEALGVKIVIGTGRLLDNRTIEVDRGETHEIIKADAILLAVGAHPRELATAQPDGERILNWTQLYDLDELPEDLIVVGSGVTGAEFASAFNGLGSKVTLISSRDQVLPGRSRPADGRRRHCHLGGWKHCHRHALLGMCGINPQHHRHRFGSSRGGSDLQRPY